MNCGMLEELVTGRFGSRGEVVDEIAATAFGDVGVWLRGGDGAESVVSNGR